MAARHDSPPRRQQSSPAAVDAFLEQIAGLPAVAERGRLLFAIDATASRETTWDHASHIQAQMFTEAGKLGGLAMQLLYYRGYGEFHASDWRCEPTGLQREMTGVRCRAGHTQIEKVLRHALAQARQGRVDALVFIGDAVEEDVQQLAGLAGELALFNVPCFLFHEGRDPHAAQVFRMIARLTRGASCSFDAGSAQQLRDLLAAVAVYAAGGHQALSRLAHRGGTIQGLLQQLNDH